MEFHQIRIHTNSNKFHSGMCISHVHPFVLSTFCGIQFSWSKILDSFVYKVLFSRLSVSKEQISSYFVLSKLLISLDCNLLAKLGNNNCDFDELVKNTTNSIFLARKQNSLSICYIYSSFLLNQFEQIMIVDNY